MKFVLIFAFAVAASIHTNAACLLEMPSHAASRELADGLFWILHAQTTCPTNVSELQTALITKGLSVAPSMVANRGRHNTSSGSFSFFEEVTGEIAPGIVINKGDFFFGHFTRKKNGSLVLDQSPSRGKLLIEAIAWDYSKQLYNFYELIGTAQSAKWFYRGDSSDILLDNTYVYRDPPPGTAKFGSRLRCSACHASGGPIMKELSAPHNDWWTKERPLPLETTPMSSEVFERVQHLMDASSFSESIKKGIHQLGGSAAYQQHRSNLSPQEQLRPLFCENEINLESDSYPLESWSPMVHVPTAFAINPYFEQHPSIFAVQKVDYLDALTTRHIGFREYQRADADYAWLTPVKGYSDIIAIDSLVYDLHIIPESFALSVLHIGISNPVFSHERCQLLKFLPDTFSADWMNLFIENLRHSQIPMANTLADFLGNSDTEWHYINAHLFLDQIRRSLQSPEAVANYVDRLIEVRKRAFESEISQNPLGQILEPGFRVIFPEAL